MSIRLESLLNTPSALPGSAVGPHSSAKAAHGSFGAAMESAIAAVEDSSGQANQAVQNFLAGDSTDVHTVAIAAQRAEVSLELFQQVRNKLVSAYQEIMRSQL